MEKYLFNDGTNVTREVQSKEELETLVQNTSDKNRIRIWIFNSSEWLSYAEFIKLSGSRVQDDRDSASRNDKARNDKARNDKGQNEKARNDSALNDTPKKVIPSESIHTAKRNNFRWLKRAFILLACVATTLLIYNFTRITWTHIDPLILNAARPVNSPPVDADSLIQEIEYARGQKLDKITKTNLRIRNTWPDRITLQLSAERDSSSTGTKTHRVMLSIDNSTGYLIDEAVVELNTWKNEQLILSDTFHFRNINYSQPAKKMIDKEYRADSISVSFSSIRAKSFNFCYSNLKESNYGNFNDRWFCK